MRFTVALVVLALVVAIAAAQSWSYANQAGWGTDFANCANTVRQSPINILTATAALNNVAFRPIQLSTSCTMGSTRYIRWTAADSTLKVAFTADSTASACTLLDPLTGGQMSLDHIAFRWTAEHALDGVKQPLSALWVFVSGGLRSVIEVPLTNVTADASSNIGADETSLVDDLLPANMPNVTGASATVETPSALRIAGIAFTQMFPLVRAYYSYAGTLSYPPCSYDTQWYVFRSPSAVSSAAIQRYYDAMTAAVGSAFATSGNTRAAQAINGHVIHYVDGSYTPTTPAPLGVGAGSANPQPANIVTVDEDQRGGYVAGIVVLSIVLVVLIAVSVMLAIRNAKQQSSMYSRERDDEGQDDDYGEGEEEEDEDDEENDEGGVEEDEDEE